MDVMNDLLSQHLELQNRPNMKDSSIASVESMYIIHQDSEYCEVSTEAFSDPDMMRGLFDRGPTYIHDVIALLAFFNAHSQLSRSSYISLLLKPTSRVLCVNLSNRSRSDLI